MKEREREREREREGREYNHKGNVKERGWGEAGVEKEKETVNLGIRRRRDEKWI